MKTLKLVCLTAIAILCLASCEAKPSGSPAPSGGVSPTTGGALTVTPVSSVSNTPTTPPTPTEDPAKVAAQTAFVAEKNGQQFTMTYDTVACNRNSVNIRLVPTSDGNTPVGSVKNGERLIRIGIGNGSWDEYYFEGQAVFGFSSYFDPVDGSGGDDSQTDPGVDLSNLKIVDISKQRYTYDEMADDLQALATKYPGRISIRDIALTRDIRHVYEAVVGNASATRHIVVVASMHGREYMTSMLVMKQIEYVLANESKAYQGQSISSLLDGVCIHVIPMANPDGVALSQLGTAGLSRETLRTQVSSWYTRDYTANYTNLPQPEYIIQFMANLNGVDLDRNIELGVKSGTGATQPGAKNYPGVSEGSEPESNAIMELISKTLPAAVIEYHASGATLYTDFGQTGDLVARTDALAEALAAVTGYTPKKVPTDTDESVGLSYWCINKWGIPAAGIEIGTGTTPLALSEFGTIFKANADVLAALAYLYK